MEKILFTALCKRLSKTPEEIIMMAIDGIIPLMATFYGPCKVTMFVPDLKPPARTEVDHWSNVTFFPTPSLLSDLMRDPATVQDKLYLEGTDIATGRYIKLTREEKSNGGTIQIGVNDLFADEVKVADFEQTPEASAATNNKMPSVDIVTVSTTARNDPLPFMDENHEFYSRELAIAVGVWLALFGEGGEYQQNRAVKEQIKALLSDKKLSGAAVNRISTLVNPRKNGGTPPSGF